MSVISMRRLRALPRLLARCTSGIALVEFAYTAPFMAMLGLYGLEVANMALAQMKVSQIASNLADVLGRTGISDGAGRQLIRESDINDAFQAVSRQAGRTNIVTRGRIIVSSLELNPANSNRDWIHWQRCFGALTTAVSAYGVANTPATGSSGTTFTGMGPAGSRIQAPDVASAVMFVEITYNYEPLVSNRFFGAKTFRTEAAFIVRDRRNLVDPNNPAAVAGVTASTC